MHGSNNNNTGKTIAQNYVTLSKVKSSSITGAKLYTASTDNTADINANFRSDLKR